MSSGEIMWHKLPDTAKLLVVGAGGIGCELLKNLVMCGFNNIEIDLDTIDVSNLNRQFLFHREHVGKSKAVVAVEAMRSLMTRMKRADKVSGINAHFGSVFDSKFDVKYFEEFDLILNALDNKAARSHVNRLCVAAARPLIESGTAGYLGQVTVIARGQSECYDCQPKPVQRTYPGCTIRNTPSEPVHCIVWAKHLFNQLFGAPEIDEDVSPDFEDPELAANGVEDAPHVNGNGATAAVRKMAIRPWAESIAFEARPLFDKLFHHDIATLLTMDTLWTTRNKPTPLKFDNCGLADLESTSCAQSSAQTASLSDQRLWTLHECRDTFEYCVRMLHGRCADTPILVWDKDDDVAMDFVTCVANIRAHIFQIAQKSRFDVKSMAGNIIPAIATTNAIIAGCMVMEAMKIMRTGGVGECRAVFLNQQPNPRRKVLVDQLLPEQNTACIVCAKARTYVTLNTERFTVRMLQDKVLKQALSMRAPDVNTVDGRIIISSEEGECDGMSASHCQSVHFGKSELLDRRLCDVAVTDYTELAADDFLQALDFHLVVVHSTKYDAHESGIEFELHTKPPVREVDSEQATLAEIVGDVSVVPVDNGVQAGIARKRSLPHFDDQTLSPKKLRVDHVGDLNGV